MDGHPCGGDGGSCTCTHVPKYKPHGPHCDLENGLSKNARRYNCKQQKVKKTCERGDLSGKLGQLEVQNGDDDVLFVKFKGVDKHFLNKSDFEASNADYSIVLSKGETHILCAKLMLLCNKS